jgi:hypothetical protein
VSDVISRRGPLVIRYHARSAFRHGISRERIGYVVEHCGLWLEEPQEGGADLVVLLGDDWRGVPLEVVAVEQAGGDLLVIHAMRLRAKYAAAYAEVRPWQRP